MPSEPIMEEATAACVHRVHLALFLSAVGVHGRERTLLAVAGQVAGQGKHVDLVTVRPSADLCAAVPPGVRLIDLERWWTRLPVLGASNKRRIYLSAPALAAYLRREQPDILLAASIPPNLTALRARRWARVATAVILRQSNVVHIRGSTRYGGVRRRPRDRLIPRLYPDAAAIVAVSAGVADNTQALAGFPRERIHTIPNWNVVPDVLERQQESVDHPWLDGERICPVLVAVGRLVPKKDYATLLRAFAKVRAKREARLIVLGQNGPERRRIDALIRELDLAGAVDLVGHQANPFAYLARADCYVLSSISEGMPNALVEALACGCPVVSTDCPSGPAEILDYGRYGQLVPPGDDRALADAILATLAEPPARERLRARGLQFSQARAVQRYVQVLETAATQAKTGPRRACHEI